MSHDPSDPFMDDLRQQIADRNREIADLRAKLAEAHLGIARLQTDVEQVIKDRDAATAACAEMRAALEAVGRERNPHSDGHVDRLVRTALSRPDLGAGMVVVPREMVERWAADVEVRAERAEADYRRLLSERAEANQLAGRCAHQRDAALAACAEMRAALEVAIEYQRDMTRKMERAVGWAPEEARKQLDLVEAALSRTDLGRGGVGPEVVALLRKKLAGASIATGLGNAGQAFELIDEARALLGDEKGGVK